MQIDDSLRVLFTAFMEAAIKAAKPTELAGIEAQVAMLRALIDSQAPKTVTASAAKQMYSVTVEHIGDVHYEGMDALAAALNITAGSCSVSLSKAKGMWGTTRIGANGNPVNVLVRRGLWGTPSVAAEQFLAESPKRAPGRPGKAEQTLHKARTAETIKRVKAAPAGTNKLKLIRSIHDEEERPDVNAPVTPDTPRLDYTGKHGEDYYIEGMRTTKASYEDHIRDRARKQAGL